MSLDTLLLLRRVLGQQTLTVGHEDFPTVAPQVLRALAELDAAITAAQDQPAP